ncbi:MAG: hypothetical protein AAB445_03155 [Patescibacteria group bacterium]
MNTKKELMSFAEYACGELSETERADLRFVPPIEVVQLNKPDGGDFAGFRTRTKNWATTFCLLPDDYVVIVAEWKHGAEEITLVPPSGVPSKIDHGSMDACAKREFEEESGILLEKVVPLAGLNGLPIASRNLTTRFYPFLGIPKLPINPGPSKLDQNEYLKMVLISLPEWLKLINSGETNEECSVSVTYLALQDLGRLSIS